MSLPPDKTTVLQALITSIASAAAYNQNAQTPPEVILWTDKAQQWLPIAPLLRSQLPHFLTWGEYDPEARTGSAIWIKCMIAKTLPEATWSDDTIPILYLPGVSRSDLRPEACRSLLQPLVELQYRGTYWIQRNSQDWTIFAFLKSKDSLGLDVAQDQNTLQATQDALTAIAETRILALQNKRLEAKDFNDLLVTDSPRDLLRWMNDPNRTRQTWKPENWSAFCNIAKETYRFDPNRDGAITAAELLAKRQDQWKTVWNRFAESPQLYANLPTLLRQAMPSARNFFEDYSAYPQYNEEQEDQLRAELLKLKTRSLKDAIAKIQELEQQHSPRRTWVWSTLKQTPLANALEHLYTLATVVKALPGGSSLQAIAEQYTQEGWQADAAVLSSIAAVDRETDLEATITAIQALYKTWLEHGAEHLQSLLKTQPYPTATPIPLEEGDCLLFADGLRYDLGQQLKAMLQDKEATLESGWQWVALPSVTATSKPAVSPIASLLTGSPTGDDFCPQITDSQQLLTRDRFLKLLDTQGIQYLMPSDTGTPTGKAWTEFGDIDKYGHQHGRDLAREVPRQLKSLVERIESLLSGGWRRVRIVTDHGWLLLPGGLPKQDLTASLTQTRWGRCAILKPTAQTQFPTYPWFWSSEVQIATATGIHCFKASLEYAHGGISLQECITPTLLISGTTPTYNATIAEWKWIGLRCRISITNGTDTMTVDIRKKAADASTSLANGGKPLKQNSASLAIEDDSTEGETAVIVLVDENGSTIAKQATLIGGDE